MTYFKQFSRNLQKPKNVLTTVVVVINIRCCRMLRLNSPNFSSGNKQQSEERPY